MAFSRRIFITLFCCFVIAKSENTNEDLTKVQDSSPQISAVLDYLNSNLNKVYEYNHGYLAGAQNKADVIEVTVEVDVDCLRTYPEIPCNEDVLTCNAFIRQNPDQTYQVLSDVKCSPKVQIIVEDVDEENSAAPMVFAEQSQSDMEKIDLSSEALSPAQGGADFVAVRRDNIPCLGCPFDLNTDADGVEELINTAVKHIESERDQRHKIVNVRRLQQQVVAGLKYILVAEVAQTMCPKDADLSAPCILDTSVEPFICEITFIQKPWISNSKHIIKNNCTLTQEYEPVDMTKRDQDDMNNEILPQGGFINPGPQDEPKPIPNYNAMAQTGNMEDDMDADRLADLESQILFGDMIEVPKVSKVDQTQNTRVPFTMVEPEYVSVDELTPVTTDTEDHLKVEPLNVEEDSLRYRIPLFNYVPVIDETEPVVTMYNYQNEEPTKTSDENIVLKVTDNYEPAQFESSLPVQERVTRHNDNADSDSDSTSEESKEKEVKAEIKNSTERSKQATDLPKTELTNDTSEESSESLNTEEKRQRVRRDTDEKSSEKLDSSGTGEQGGKIRPRRAADKNNNNDDNNDSSSSSSSSSDDDDNNDNNNDNNNIKNDNTRREKSQKLKKANDNDNNNNDNSSSSSSSSSDEDNNNERHKRSIRQMEKIPPDEKAIVRDLADFVAATMDNIDDDHHKRVILQILGAKKLKLEGIYYQIILRLGISHCHEHEHNENCREKLFTNLTKICKVQVHVDDDYSNPKVVKSQCQNIKKDENDRNRTNYSRYKRGILVGGHTSTPTDGPEVQKYVKDTLNHLDSVSDHPNKHKTVRIVSATTQVVAGVKYTITALIGLSDCSKSENKLLDTCGLLEDSDPETCTIEVWDRSWLNKTIYTIKCNDTEYKFGDKEESIRRKRELRVKGGQSEISKDSDDVLNHLTNSLVYLDSKSEHENSYIVDEVLSASKQVVAGSLFRIRARIAVSDCKKGSGLKNCTKLNGTHSGPTVCKFKIWEKPWLNFTQTNITCDNDNQSHSFRRKRSIYDGPLLGGQSEISKDSEDVLNHLSRSLVYLDSKSEHENRYIVDEILNATQQVVAGWLYRIRARIVLSDCKKGSELKNCTKLNDTLSGPTVCKFKIWEQSWLNFTQTNITCDDNQSHSFRRKRSIYDGPLLGGLAPISKDSEEVLNHLSRSLVYLDSKSEHENRYIVDEILNATQQVVAGWLYRIRARIVLSDCKKGSELKNCKKLNDTLSGPTVCKFKIWEQPWLNFTQTNITCDNNQIHSFRRKRSLSTLFNEHLLDAPEELPIDNIEAKNFIKMALEYISSKSETSGKYKLKEIKQVTRRIVTGTIWYIVADIALCRQVELLRTTYSMCPDSSENIKCSFLVLNRPWDTNGLTINITCNNDNQEYSYMPVHGFSENKLSSFDYERNFKRFIIKYNKVYGDEEYSYRFKVYRDNINKIALLNKYEKGTAQYGVTRFADMTEREFSLSHGYRPELQNENELPLAQAKIPDIKIPTEFDWRTKGAVTAVKDQGMCGSCWAFSVTGNVEGQYAIKHGKLLEFSEQELVDCDKVDQGCNGGLMDNAYRVIEKLGGLETEADYPYEGDDETCHFNPGKVEVELNGAVNISHNETDMAKWLVQNGPISIALNANAMQFYVGGVSHPWKMLCNPNSLDHGVLIVGYGVHKYTLFNKTLPYWIVKNSWSSSWGEQGYYRVYRGDGTCGLNQTPSSAIVA